MGWIYATNSKSYSWEGNMQFTICINAGYTTNIIIIQEDVGEETVLYSAFNIAAYVCMFVYTDCLAFHLCTCKYT